MLCVRACVRACVCVQCVVITVNLKLALESQFWPLVRKTIELLFEKKFLASPSIPLDSGPPHCYLGQHWLMVFLPAGLLSLLAHLPHR